MCVMLEPYIISIPECSKGSAPLCQASTTWNCSYTSPSTLLSSGLHMVHVHAFTVYWA